MALLWKQVCKKKRVKLGALMLVLLSVFHFYPMPENIQQRDLSKVLLAENGALLAAKIAQDQQWRFPHSQELPEKYLRALLEFEDQYFYYHPGINPFALLRAVYSNIKSKRIVSGGSTISMQLARLLRQDPPRTYANKAIEALLAFKLEWHFSKTEIVSLYAAHAPFGGNTVGFTAASWRYFSHLALQANYNSQLTWAEAALLAVLPNSPALIHPGRGRNKLKKKRDRLLKRLFNKGLITKNEYQLSLLETLPQKPQALPRLAPHLLETLIAKYPSKNLFHSTVLSNIQQALVNMANSKSPQLTAQGVHNFAVVIIDNQNLSTVAYLGNNTAGPKAHLYAKDVDIATRPRSTGSILKPFLYALMLQEGLLLPETLIPDVPINFSGFTPENFDHDYRGAVAAKQALASSLNIPAVNMLKQYGQAKFYDKLKQLGLSTLFRNPEDYGLSLILGGAESNLLELSNINAILTKVAASGGNSIENPQVKILQQSPKVENTFPIQQGAAWLTLDALLEVARPGQENAWRTFSSSQKIAWKTGTSYGLRDAWAIGNSSKFTVGVWAGNASGEGVAGLSGLNTAAPLMFKVFNFLGNSQWIEKPEFALKPVKTCLLDGFLANGHCETQISFAPLNSHFQKSSPFYRAITLDTSQQFRVHGECESVGNMLQENRFILPPHQELYWRPHHKEYRPLPPWRKDCIASLANYSNDMPMEIIYPLNGAKIYIPIELSGKKGEVIFKASHRNKNAKIYWHVDQGFVQTTEYFHNITLDLPSGQHKLVLIDQSGNRLQTRFTILEK